MALATVPVASLSMRRVQSLSESRPILFGLLKPIKGLQESAGTHNRYEKEKKARVNSIFSTFPLSTNLCLTCFVTFFPLRNLLQLCPLLWRVILPVFTKWSSFAHVADVELPLLLHCSQKTYRCGPLGDSIPIMTASPPTSISFRHLPRRKKGFKTGSRRLDQKAG